MNEKIAQARSAEYHDPLEDKAGILLMPPMTEQEKIDRWSPNCDVKPLSPEASNFMSSQNPVQVTANSCNKG